MNPPRRRLLGLAASAAVLPLAAGVRAQAYPSRPISMIVPARGRRPDRCDRPRARRAHGRALGQTDRDRQCRRRRRLDRRRQARARRARRLHAGHRPVVALCAERCDLHAAIRPAEGLRADLAADQRPVAAGRAQDAAGQRPQGADRLAQGQSRTRPRPAPAASARRAHLRHLLPEADRHAVRLRALSRHRRPPCAT